MKQAEGALKRELAQFSCPNPAGAALGKGPAEGGKLWGDRGHGREQLRLVRCARGRKPCSARRATALEEARLPAVAVEKSGAHWQEGWGMGRPARLRGPARSTGARYAVGAGAHARAGQDATLRERTWAESPAAEPGAVVGNNSAPLRRGGSGPGGGRLVGAR